LSVKQRNDDEVLQLLNEHGVPEDLSLKVFYAQIHEQVDRLNRLAPGGRSSFSPGKVAESFTRTFGFSHWMTLRYLLRRRDRMRKRQQATPEPAPEIDTTLLSKEQQDYLKKLRWRKAEVLEIRMDGKKALITHRTGGGNLATYEVNAKGSAVYVSQAEKS
jgi:hypothetical protein